MKLQNLLTLPALFAHALGFPNLVDSPEYRSLAGLSPEEIQTVVRHFKNTPAHPYHPDRPGDIRGPCPGLNTLASHGYINRNGVASPAEIINAVQEGFNMGWSLASFITYGAFIVDGNHLTNLMSIGANTTADHELTPGLNIHGNFEGDASTTRGDYYFGDNFSFNETLFDQLVYTANLVGDGHITIESAALDKALRINDSIARNPTFSFDTPRFLTAYAETTFPLAFFVSNQTTNTTLNVTLDDARSFFESHKFPEGFYRRQGPYDIPELRILSDEVFALVQVFPGHNEGVDNYIVDVEDSGTLCYMCQKQVNLTAQLYPNPTPKLKVGNRNEEIGMTNLKATARQAVSWQ